MENYTKGESTEESVDPPPFKDLRDDFVHMKVQPNSKLRNLLEYAKKAFKDEAKRQMVFTGSGHALAKTISCVEIMKRKHKGVHQVNKILYKKVEDCWEPKSPEFDRLKIVREIPTMHILLSKDPVDTTQLGYQAPGCTDGSWSTEQKSMKPRKKQFPKRTPRRQKTQQSEEQ
ncbi:ribonuclease P protein subunit p25-like protein isoform X2 [Rhipicephalus microplus]|uniref:ribonuclease P protein subunit p25-like protein n=2 Tax=Rhipicephalus microplus TaxID=6941 RepID=UPI0018879C13|nr:ribonuclease P protein subunit p25-like protein isoform X2 [Rhipicephalus microplus]